MPRPWTRVRIAVVVCALCANAVVARAQSALHPTTRVSVASDGTSGNGYSMTPAMSADGRCVAFASAATNVVAGDTNGQLDVFVHDLRPASDAACAASLFRPDPGSTLTASIVTFEWTAGRDVSQVVLYVGTEGPGSYDIYCASQGTRLSAPVSRLPVDGRPI